MITTAISNSFTKSKIEDYSGINITNSEASLGTQVKKVGTSTLTLRQIVCLPSKGSEGSAIGVLGNGASSFLAGRYIPTAEQFVKYASPVIDARVVSNFSEKVAGIVLDIGETPSAHASDCFSELASVLKINTKFGMIMSDKTKLIARESVLKMQAWSNVDINDKPLADANNRYGVKLEVVKELSDFIKHKEGKGEAEQVRNLAKNSIEAVLSRALAYESGPDKENNVAGKLKSFLQLAILHNLSSNNVEKFCEAQGINALS
jgi:hypothetical protein